MSRPAGSRSAESRARLLQAAVEAFGARGFHGTTTRDIAMAAGMSPAGVYVHHKSKEELLQLIAKEGHEETLRLLEQAQAVSADPVDQLREIMFRLVVDHARNHIAKRVVNYELSALEAAHAEEIRMLRRRIDAAVREVVAAGVATGAFRVRDPRMTATALLSLVIDTGRWFRDGARWTPEDVGHEYAELALRMVGAPLTATVE